MVSAHVSFLSGLFIIKTVKGFITCIMTWDQSVRVTLNSDSTGCFYTGDIVTGIVSLDLDKDHKIESVDLEVVGICKAKWSRASPTIPYIKIYSEKKKVLFIKIENIFGNFQRGNKIPKGIYSYPFHFALADDLPSTFRSSIASVYYNVKIKSKPVYKLRKVVPFNVVGNVNINNKEDMLAPYLYEFQKYFKNVGGKVSIYVKTFKGIAPRQTIPFEITINNEKKISISRINVALIQKLHYSISSGFADVEKKICEVEYKKIGKTMTEICKLSMDIPHVTPTSIHMVNPMIDIAYVFRVAVCFPFHFNMYEDVPVTIAAVPVIHHDF